MARYIDADTLYVKVKAECNPYGKPTISFDDGCKGLDMIRRTPTADVAPVIHAHWETDEHAALDFCSSCGEAVERYVTAEQMDKSNYKGATYWNYCPHCGAKMDEESHTEEVFGANE